MTDKINSHMYKTEFESEALKFAKEISGSENDLFSIILSYSEIFGKYIFFIERGCPFVRTGETLIGKYENGKIVVIND